MDVLYPALDSKRAALAQAQTIYHTYTDTQHKKDKSALYTRSPYPAYFHTLIFSTRYVCGKSGWLCPPLVASAVLPYGGLKEAIRGIHTVQY